MFIWICRFCVLASVFLYGFTGYSEHRETSSWSSRMNNIMLAVGMSVIIYFIGLFNIVKITFWPAPIESKIVMFFGAISILRFSWAVGKFLAKKENLADDRDRGKEKNLKRIKDYSSSKGNVI